MPWIGTFATGLASGITSHPGSTISPLGYHELYAMIRDYYLLSQLLQGKSMQTAQNNAHRFAQRRCQRTYLGGVCSPQDNSYLHGTLLLEDFFKDNDPNQTLKRLSVGCISTEHLPDCYQLGIIEPSIPHRQLARQEAIQQAILDLITQKK
ncbi:MAG: hypothetical protein J2P36_20525 [Ktedonobacteraceae bacterium]|nr:hypothetical protein [Ktedonobacteraceae bacterium]